MKNYKLRGRVRRTIEAANRVDGRGDVIKLIWHPSERSGLAVRRMVDGMDGVQFQLLSRGVRVLGRARVLLP